MKAHKQRNASAYVGGAPFNADFSTVCFDLPVFMGRGDILWR